MKSRQSTIDEHEQYSRRNSLRISGVPETTNEDSVDVTLTFMNKELGLAAPIGDSLVFIFPLATMLTFTSAVGKLNLRVL